MRMYICVCIYTYVNIFVYIYIYVYKYMYIYISPLCYPLKLLSPLHRHGLISNDMGTSDLYMPKFIQM